MANHEKKLYYSGLFVFYIIILRIKLIHARRILIAPYLQLYRATMWRVLQLVTHDFINILDCCPQNRSEGELYLGYNIFRKFFSTFSQRCLSVTTSCAAGLQKSYTVHDAYVHDTSVRQIE
eukprot:UN08297